MAGGGIGEAALISAAIGGTTAAATGGDPLRGALLGGLTGGMTSGIGGLLAPEATAIDAGTSTLGREAITNAAGYTPEIASGTPLSEVNALSGYNTATTIPNPANPLNATSMSDFLKSGSKLGIGTLAATGAGAGLADAMRAERERYRVPTPEKYAGPLSKFSYEPSTYTPFTYRPYAGGGPVEAMSNANAVGANTGFPMADIQRGAYATPYQQPISQNVVTGASDTRVDPYTGEERLAGGGIASLGGYSDGGRLLRGPGDGVSDSIPATISDREPARLADGEFVVPARIVSELGNGSTDAGARQLYKMMDRVQSARSQTMGKGKIAKNTKASRYLPA